MDLDIKLKIWPKDGSLNYNPNLSAQEYCCVICNENGDNIPAVSFYPNYDSEIPKRPFCLKHIYEYEADEIPDTLEIESLTKYHH